MKKLAYLAIGGSIIGVALILMGIWMGYCDVAIFAFPNPQSAPWGFALLGTLIVLLSVAPYFDQNSQTRKQRIEQQDERNLFHFYKSCCYAYSCLMGVGVLTLLFLTMLGYMNIVSFFTLVTIFVFSFMIQVVVRIYLNHNA